MPSACQNTRSAPQKQPIPTTSFCISTGKGCWSGVPRTTWRLGTRIGVSRPGSASSGDTILVFFSKRNMAKEYGCQVIEARDLTKDYGKKRAADGLSFTVQPGVVTGFLGPNGSGKSTTMRLIL